MSPEREIDRYSGPARIKADGRRTFDVHCSFRVVQDVGGSFGGAIVAGLTSWRGVFNADTAMGLETGEAIIELPNGRSGDIVVTRVSYHATHGTVDGEFVGNGPAPE